VFDSLAALMPMIEKKFKLKQQAIVTPDEFKAAVKRLAEGDAKTSRVLLEAEHNGRPCLAVLVIK
jgi:hypothetical protein